jgi:hypothetical protein
MSRPQYQPVFRDDRCRQWHDLYQGWMAYAEAHNEERRNGWKKLSRLAVILSGETEPAFLQK